MKFNKVKTSYTCVCTIIYHYFYSVNFSSITDEDTFYQPNEKQNYRTMKNIK